MEWLPEGLKEKFLSLRRPSSQDLAARCDTQAEIISWNHNLFAEGERFRSTFEVRPWLISGPHKI